MLAMSVELKPAVVNVESGWNVRLIVKARAGPLAAIVKATIADRVIRTGPLLAKISSDIRRRTCFIILRRRRLRIAMAIVNSIYYGLIRDVTESFAGAIDVTSARDVSASSCDNGTIARKVVVVVEPLGTVPPDNVT